MSDPWPAGTLVKVSGKSYIGPGHVTKWMNTDGGIMVHVEFQNRDFETWFSADLLKKIDVIELLGQIGDD